MLDRLDFLLMNIKEDKQAIMFLLHEEYIVF